jgi:hypothetical protein
MRVSWLGVVLVVGCADGRIKLEDLDRFGKVRSGVWFEFKNQQPDGTQVQYHQFVLADRPRLCEDVKELVPELAAVYDNTLGNAPAGNGAAQCDAYGQYLAGAAAATEDLFKKGLSTLVLDFVAPLATPDQPPEEDTYVVGFTETEAYVTGSLVSYEESPWAVASEDLNCGDYDWFDQFDRALDDVRQGWLLSDGEAELTAKGTSKFKIKLDGELIEPDLDPAGDIKVRAKARYCEVQWQGADVFRFGVSADDFVTSTPATTTEPTE